MKEIWKPVAIKEWSSTYAVSDRGRIRRAIPGKGTRAGRVLATHTNTNGYQNITLHANGIKKSTKVHRLVAITFLGPARGREVNHRNGDKTDNKVSNLEWVTRSRNIRHSFETGSRTTQGSRNGNAKINESEVRTIRDLLRTENRNAVVANQARILGIEVSATTVYQIRNRIAWKHV